MVCSNNNGFFHNIRSQFGNEATSLLKSWTNNMTRTCRARQQLTFLLRCRRHDTLPPHIQHMRLNTFFNSRSVNNKFNNLKRRYQRTILNLEIRDINNHIKFLRSEVFDIENNLFACLPEDLVNNFFKFNEKKFNDYNRSVKTKSINKFNDIVHKGNVHNPFFKIDNTKWLVNISKKIIPDHVKNFVSLGDKFGLPTTSFNKKDRLHTILDTVKNFEVNSYKIPQNVVNRLRGSVADSLQVFLNKDNHINYLDRYILNEFKKCKKFLHDNDDVLVTKADKGQITVIMDKDDYIKKMTELLDDQLTYKKLTKDPIKQLTSKINQLVKSWLDNDIIDNQLYNRLRCTNGNLPRCYGLPKVHKSGFPLRIIVSTLGSPLYNIACFLHGILYESVRRPNSYIKDSWSFVRAINKEKIDADQLLISLDVTALFTNIPKELVFRGIEKRWTDISSCTKFSLPQFLFAIEFVLSSTSFRFNGQLYEQIFGSPMGSPLSPILADIVMDDLETHCLNALDFRIPVFYRYVDDIFAVVPKSRVCDILNVFNSYHPRLKFTHEIEINNSIPFLDTIVIKEGNSLLTNWYRKPTFSGRYVNYFSSHPHNYKINSIISLVDRAILLSDKRFHLSNISIIRNILLNNCFPLDVINRQINKRLKQLQNNNNKNDNVNNFDARKLLPIPYIKGLSENVHRTLKCVDLNVVYSIPKKLDVIIKRGKDKLDKNSETELVYKINCKDCNMSYIGQTKRHLETRIKEHRNDIKKHIDNHSVVGKHIVSRGHDFDWLGAEILHKEKHTRKREIAEMFFIKKCDNTINLKKDTDNLNPVYDKVISAI